MKTTAIKKITGLFIISLGIFFSSCEKLNDETEKDLDVNIDEELYVSDVFDEIVEISDEAMDLYETQGLKTTDGFHYNRLSDCVTVTRVVTDSIKITTIDFGDTNCLCNDDRLRRGKIIVAHEGNYWDASVIVTITFADFFVDDNQVTGVKEITQSINEDGNRVSAIELDGALILADGTGTITWAASRTREIVAGSETHTKWDDITETTGSSSWTLPDGSEGNSEITEPLVRKHEIGCMYIIQGVRVINRTNESEITIDYGDGTCDNLAEITVDGVTQTIALKRLRSYAF